MKTITIFSLINILISGLLYFLNINSWKAVFFSVIFFFVVHLVIAYLTKVANKNEVETLVTAIGLNIGVKFISSLAYIFLMYTLQIFEGSIPILMFMFYHFIYTFLIARFGVNRLI